MKILLLGAKGQVGREVMAKSSAHDIFAADLPEYDLTQTKVVDQLFEEVCPQVVINLAAYTAVDRAESEPKQCHAINNASVTSISQACQRLGAALIHVSTDYVFDGKLGRPYVEQDAPNPLNVYGMSKWQAELTIQRRLSRYLIVRTAWVFGQFGDNFVKTMTRLAQTKTSLKIVDDQFGNPTPAADLAERLLVLADKLYNHQVPAGIVHVAGARAVSRLEFAQKIIETWAEQGNQPVPIKAAKSVGFPVAATRPMDARLDVTKALQIYGLSPIDWEAGLFKFFSTNLDASG